MKFLTNIFRFLSFLVLVITLLYTVYNIPLYNEYASYTLDNYFMYVLISSLALFIITCLIVKFRYDDDEDIIKMFPSKLIIVPNRVFLVISLISLASFVLSIFLPDSTTTLMISRVALTLFIPTFFMDIFAHNKIRLLKIYKYFV